MVRLSVPQVRQFGLRDSRPVPQICKSAPRPVPSRRQTPAGPATRAGRDFPCRALVSGPLPRPLYSRMPLAARCVYLTLKKVGHRNLHEPKGPNAVESKELCQFFYCNKHFWITNVMSKTISKAIKFVVYLVFKTAEHCNLHYILPKYFHHEDIKTKLLLNLKCCIYLDTVYINNLLYQVIKCNGKLII